MIESSSRSTTALRTLEPSHCERVKGVKVPEHSLLLTLASEDNDTCTSKDSRVTVAGWRRRARDPWLDPARRVDIENVRVVKVGESGLFTLIVMATENDE